MNLLKPSRQQIGEKPKEYQAGISIYCPTVILDRLDLSNEVKRINKTKRVARKIKLNTLRIHMMMVINYLSNQLTFDNSIITNIHSSKFREVSKLYRVCIDILKEKKILFVCSRDGVETYMVSEYSKGYRWNLSYKHTIENSKPYKIRVTDHRLVKKIVHRVGELQCFHHHKDNFTRIVRTINPYAKRKLQKTVNTLEQWYSNVNHLGDCLNCVIYADDDKIKGIEVKKKWGLANGVAKKWGYKPKGWLIKTLSFRELKRITDHAEEQLVAWRIKAGELACCLSDVAQIISGDFLEYFAKAET